MPVLEFDKVISKVLPRYMNMRTTDRILNPRPEAFHAVRVVDAVYPFFLAMVAYAVRISVLVKPLVCGPFVGTQRSVARDVIKNMGRQCLAGCIRDNTGNNFTATLDHTEHRSLAFHATSSTLPSFASANVSLVNFNMAGKPAIAIRFAHVLADLVAHAPRALVGHTKLALQFFRRNTVARRGEQVKCVKPFLKGRAGSLEWGADHWVNVMTAPSASIGWHFLNAREFPNLRAFRAFGAITVASSH